MRARYSSYYIEPCQCYLTLNNLIGWAQPWKWTSFICCLVQRICRFIFRSNIQTGHINGRQKHGTIFHTVSVIFFNFGPQGFEKCRLEKCIIEVCWDPTFLLHYNANRNMTRPHGPILLKLTTFTSSMQESMIQGMQQILEYSCFRCETNTWHVESKYIFQPLKYVIIIVNRFRDINNNVTKGRYSIPMDKAVVLGLHKFSLHATKIIMDHLCILVIVIPLSTVAKTFYCNDSKITEIWNETIDTKTSSTVYVDIYIYWLNNVFILEQGVVV